MKAKAGFTNLCVCGAKQKTQSLQYREKSLWEFFRSNSKCPMYGEIPYRNFLLKLRVSSTRGEIEKSEKLKVSSPGIKSKKLE